ncbi:MAG: cadmium-translocating P-type ATPase [Kosmotoga sp.]|nr:MAG: cadmium-translocating P-type ATPase [Kosmotoga sp.]
MATSNTQKKEYVVKGMTCASCVTAVEKAASKTKGVKKPSVNLTTEKLTFEIDKDFDKQNLEEKIKHAGYEIEEIDNNRQITLEIEGMTCASCVAAVENSLKKLEGVASVSVNLMTEKAEISYNPDTVKINDVKSAVEKTGYKAKNIISESYERDKQRKEKLTISYFKRFLVSAIFAVPLLIIAMGPMIGLQLPAFLSPQNSPLNFALIQLFLTVPILIAGRDFYLKGIPNLFRGHPNMDTLVGLGTGAAMIYSLFSTINIFFGSTEQAINLYYETAGVLITLILLGKYFENLSKGKTSEAIKKLMNLAPKTAMVKRNGKYVEIPAEEIEVGDEILVKAGMSVPADGTVISGHSSLDKSMLTGESIPVDIEEGDNVAGGTVNLSGAIEIKATKVGNETALAKIIKLVEEAQSSKAPIARLADVISGYFVPIVLVIATITFITWLLLGFGLVFSLTMMIAVLVIACPCALGLATPTAIMVGTGRGAETGILFKNGEALEITHAVDSVILDKTGTITEGKPELTDVIPLNGYNKQMVLKLAASMAKKSSHPLDKPVARAYNDETFEVSDFAAIPGKGIKGLVNDKQIKLGSTKFVETDNPEIEKINRKLSNEGKTVIALQYGNETVAIMGIADVIKDNSKEAVDKLKKAGIKTYMVTGDSQKTAEAIANEVGIDEVLAEVMPEDKAKVVSKLKNEGKKVAMVGDGINDSPALAAADIGIAIGSGTDIAIEAADIVLMKDSLNDVVKAIDLSRATIRNVKQNLFWAFFYNSVGIPVAAGVFFVAFGFKLNPMIAGAAMAFSSVSVVLNALRLKKIKLKSQKIKREES